MTQNQKNPSRSSLQNIAATVENESPGNPEPFPYEDYQAARQALEHALSGPPFYALVLGSSGTGKTSLIRELAAHLDRRRTQIVYVSSSRTNSTAIALACARRLHLGPRRSYLDTVNLVAQAMLAQPSHWLLWVDEAHDVDAQTLNEIRNLAEADATLPQLFSVVLCGLPLLAQHLDAGDLFPLKRRIGTTRLTLSGLRRPELEPFLRFRFGSEQAKRIPPLCQGEIFERTGGAPALIDRVVRAALVGHDGLLTEEKLHHALDRCAL
jgi:type II secretory pathway predicted ATPase ExeA